jgi:TRAP-type transport system periplasmic protein
LPIGFQMALNGYAISLKSWNQLKPDQQAKLKAAFDNLTNDIWKYSEELFQDALNCNQGKDPCTTGKKFKLVNVPVTPADMELVRGAVSKVSLPVWAEVCDKSNADCSKNWKATVAPVLGLK